MVRTPETFGSSSRPDETRVLLGKTPESSCAQYKKLVFLNRAPTYASRAARESAQGFRNKWGEPERESERWISHIVGVGHDLHRLTAIRIKTVNWSFPGPEINRTIHSPTTAIMSSNGVVVLRFASSNHFRS
jgi:hypothetical protein